MVLEKEDCRVSTKLMAVEPDVFILKVKSDYSLPLYQFSTRVFHRSWNNLMLLLCELLVLEFAIR